MIVPAHIIGEFAAENLVGTQGQGEILRSYEAGGLGHRVNGGFFKNGRYKMGAKISVSRSILILNSTPTKPNK
jgi:hypothetical protein